MFRIRNATTAFPMESGTLLLAGRAEQCDIQIDDPSVSRVHCRFLASGGAVFLTDASSRWGTFVNGKRVTECELRPGDEITLGETTLRLEVVGDSVSTTMAPDSPQPEFPAASALANPALPSPHQFPGVTPQRLLPGDYEGRIFAECRVEQCQHRTASGLIFRASRSGQPVALKLYHPGAFSDKTALPRFQRAIETVQGLRHDNLVELIAGGVAEGIPYTISEWVHGVSADQMIQQIGVAGMLDWRTVLSISIDLAKALVFIESQGILHRNITPGHILIESPSGIAKLNDLLLAKALDDDKPQLTQAGTVLGTIPYLSPEQVGSGQPVDHRSDIYQVGAALYGLLTGHAPAEGRTTAEVMQHILTTAPPPPTRYHLAIPALFEGTVMTMLAKRPVDRFATSIQLLASLERARTFLMPETANRNF